jgi:hypothetical protein
MLLQPNTGQIKPMKWWFNEKLAQKQLELYFVERTDSD